MTRPENDDSREPTVAGAGRDESMVWYDSEIEAEVRAWTSEPDHADLSLITRYLAGELSPEDRMHVEHRLSTDPEFRALAEPVMMIWEIPGPLDGEPNRADRMLAERTWEKLEKRIELEEAGIHTPTPQEKRRKRRNRRRAVIGSISGAIALWLVGWLRPQLIPVPSMFAHVDAPVYEERSLKLENETQVILAPGSHLSYKNWFSTFNVETLYVNGEATFTIAPGRHRTLLVDGAGVEVRASAGRFTVHSYDGEPMAYVQVHEGSAEVRARTVYAGGEVLRLDAGEGVRVGPGLHIDRVNVITPNSVRIR